MRNATTSVLAAALLLVTLTACGTEPEASAKPTAESAEQELTPEEEASVRAAVGIPEEPTGSAREELLAAIASVAPEAARYEEKAIDAARNQCSVLNDTGGKRLDWAASQRFTYEDVTTTEPQGKALNKVLRDSGFCQA